MTHRVPAAAEIETAEPGPIALPPPPLPTPALAVSTAALTTTITSSSSPLTATSPAPAALEVVEAVEVVSVAEARPAVVAAAEPAGPLVVTFCGSTLEELQQLIYAITGPIVIDLGGRDYQFLGSLPGRAAAAKPGAGTRRRSSGSGAEAGAPAPAGLGLRTLHLSSAGMTLMNGRLLLHSDCMMQVSAEDVCLEVRLGRVNGVRRQGREGGTCGCRAGQGGALEGRE